MEDSHMKNDLEKSNKLCPNYGANELIAAIAQDATTKQILMLAWMNEEAFTKTIETGEAHYWSRSRNQLWHKGTTSGAVQHVHEILIDCDQDTVILMVDQTGAACHTSRPTCFYRKIVKAEVGTKSFPCLRHGIIPENFK